MRLYYQEKDITDRVEVLEAKCHNGIHEICGCDILLNEAEKWYAWQPKIGDTIRLTDGKLDSGKMYLDSVMPQDGRFRLIGLATKMNRQAKAWQSFEKMTLSQIASQMAAESGLGLEMWGISGGYRYEWLVRKNETPIEFMQRLAMLEGGTLKLVDGKMTLISWDYARSLSPAMTYELRADNILSHWKIGADRASAMTGWGLYGTAAAQSGENGRRLRAYLPAPDTATAKRWARGILLEKNSHVETVTLRVDFEHAATAMGRVNVIGGTDMDGAWLVRRVEHDYKRGISEEELIRCV